MTQTPALIETTELAVCTVCIHLLANGEFNDGTDAADVAAAGIDRIWGDTAELVPGDGDEWFSWSDCDACGDTLGGGRHQAFAIERVAR